MSNAAIDSTAMQVASSLQGARNVISNLTNRIANATQTYELIQSIRAAPIILVDIPSPVMTRLDLSYGQLQAVLALLSETMKKAEVSNTRALATWAEYEVMPKMNIDPDIMVRALGTIEEAFEQAGLRCSEVAALGSFALGAVDGFFSIVPLFKVR